MCHSIWHRFDITRGKGANTSKGEDRQWGKTSAITGALLRLLLSTLKAEKKRAWEKLLCRLLEEKPSSLLFPFSGEKGSQLPTKQGRVVPMLAAQPALTVRCHLTEEWPSAHCGVQCWSTKQGERFWRTHQKNTSWHSGALAPVDPPDTLLLLVAQKNLVNCFVNEYNCYKD